MYKDKLITTLITVMITLLIAVTICLVFCIGLPKVEEVPEEDTEQITMKRVDMPHVGENDNCKILHIEEYNKGKGVTE